MRMDWYAQVNNSKRMINNVKYSVFLTTEDWMTKLIVRHYYKKVQHAIGTNHALAIILKKFLDH